MESMTTTLDVRQSWTRRSAPSGAGRNATPRRRLAGTGKLGRPHCASSAEGVGLQKTQGISVFSTGEPISAESSDETLRQMRRERELGFLGNPPARGPRRKKLGEMVLRQR